MRIIIVVLIFLSTLIPESFCKVKLVIDVIRHGARSGLMESEYFKDLKWDSLGELTPIGERQHCLLGMLRREEYIGSNKLLSETYDPSLIYVRSTPSNRTLMSAQAYLTCMYPTGLKTLNKQQMTHKYDLLKPPIKYAIDNKIIDDLQENATPHSMPSIPIQTVNYSTEGLLLYNDCPYVIQEINNYFSSDGYKDLTKNSEVWVKFRQMHPEIDESYYLEDRNGYLLADLFICADTENRAPKSLSKSDIEGFKEYFAKVQKEFLKKEPINKIMMHDFVKEVIRYMNDAKNDDKKPKYILYSAHDITIGMILIGLNKIEEKIDYARPIPFASNLLFELNENNGKFSVIIKLNGKEIYNKEYEDFTKQFKEVGNIGKDKKEACKVKNTLK